MGRIFPSRQERVEYRAAGKRSDDLRAARRVIAQVRAEADAAGRRGDARARNDALREVARIKVANHIG